VHALLTLGCAGLAAGLLAAGPAVAAGTDVAPAPVCFTYFPSEVPTDGGTDTAVPSDSGGPTDTAVPTDQPSGPYTACAEPVAAGVGGGSGDPLAYSGSDNALLAAIAAALLGVGIALSMLTARRSRRTH
jgi:hypothetical protein